MKKTPEQEREKDLLLTEFQKQFIPIGVFDCDEQATWILPNGNMIASLGEHADMVDTVIKNLFPYKIKQLQSGKDYDHSYESFNAHLVQYFEKTTDSIRVRCRRDEHELNFELNQEQEKPTEDQEKKLKDLLCSGNFNKVYFDITEPEENKWLWDSQMERTEQGKQRKKDNKSLESMIELDDCTKLGTKLINDFAITRQEKLSKIYK
jgi:hypothetical protein